MKKFAAIALAASMVLGLSGCGNSGSAQTSDTATAENPMVLTLAHGLSESHTVHIAMTEFAEKVEERTDGRIKVEIYPNGQLGSENENMEQLMAGVISMTKVSAPGLATYNEAYHTFGLPYIFDDTEDFYHKMDSQEMRDFFLSTEEDGFVTITYYTSGARSFYTKDTPVRTPEDPCAGYAIPDRYAGSSGRNTCGHGLWRCIYRSSCLCHGSDFRCLYHCSSDH